MPDRNKVIRALDCWLHSGEDLEACKACPYFLQFEYDPYAGWCDEQLVMEDALALLKETEPVDAITDSEGEGDFGSMEDPINDRN